MIFSSKRLRTFTRSACCALLMLAGFVASSFAPGEASANVTYYLGSPSSWGNWPFGTVYATPSVAFHVDNYPYDTNSDCPVIGAGSCHLAVYYTRGVSRSVVLHDRLDVRALRHRNRFLCV